MKANASHGGHARRWAAVALMVWVLGVLSSVAQAAEPTAGNETDLKIQADTLMGDSKWAEAGPVYSRLYAMTHKSGYLWNAAVCKYRLAMAGTGTADEAEALFDQYLGSPDLADDDIKEAKRCIADLEAYKTRRADEAKKKAEAERAALAAAAPVSGSGAPAAATPAPLRRRRPVAATARQSHGGPPRSAAYVVGGISVASLIAGAVFSGIAHSEENSVGKATTFNPSDDSLGQTANTMQYLMYGLGAAGLVFAGILYHLSPETPSPSSSVAVLPAIGSGFGGAGITGRF